MDYLTILATPAITARPAADSYTTTWYYHGACVTKDSFILISSYQTGYNVVEWRPGDDVTDNIQPSQPACDHCGQRLDRPPLPRRPA